MGEACAAMRCIWFHPLPSPFSCDARVVKTSQNRSTKKIGIHARYSPTATREIGLSHCLFLQYTNSIRAIHFGSFYLITHSIDLRHIRWKSTYRNQIIVFASLC